MSPYGLSDAELETLLLDDTPGGDATTFALGIGGRMGQMTFRARTEMVLCGAEEALRMGLLRGLQPSSAVHCSGERLLAGEEILRFEGDAARCVRPDIGVTCTRKNFPGTKQAIPVNASTRIAAAGGINSANAESDALAGADILVTSAPYFAPPRDVAVTLTTA